MSEAPSAAKAITAWNARAPSPGEAALLAALQKCKEVMSAAFDDIGQHLSVARYNLTGMTQTGDQMPIPDPPMLIHSKGIRDSEMVRELLREGIRTIAALSAAQTKE